MSEDIIYTDPASVERIMEKIGTRGVLNSDAGLHIFSAGQCLHLHKGDKLRIENDGSLKVIR